MHLRLRNGMSGLTTVVIALVVILITVVVMSVLTNTVLDQGQNASEEIAKNGSKVSEEQGSALSDLVSAITNLDLSYRIDDSADPEESGSGSGGIDIEGTDESNTDNTEE